MKYRDLLKVRAILFLSLAVLPTQSNAFTKRNLETCYRHSVKNSNFYQTWNDYTELVIFEAGKSFLNCQNKKDGKAWIQFNRPLKDATYEIGLALKTGDFNQVFEKLQKPKQ